MLRLLNKRDQVFSWNILALLKFQRSQLLELKSREGSSLEKPIMVEVQNLKIGVCFE